MKQHHTITKATAAFLALGLLACSCAWLVSRELNEPQHEGRPLSYHLFSLTYGDVRRERAAREAVRAMGTNAVPHLIRILEAREPRFKTCFNELARRQSVIRFRLEPLSVRQMHAALACQELGPVAAPAIPALAALVVDPELAQWAVPALAEIGPQTFPLLTNALFSGNTTAKAAAAGSLRHMRPRELGVPPLLRTLESPDAALRSLAVESLGAIGLDSSTIVSALIPRLDDVDNAVRISAARSLGWLGHSASAAVPRLIQLYRSEEGMPGQWHVASALAAIDSNAAEREGVK